MVWVPQWRWSHTILKGRGVDVLHYGVPINVFNLSQNQLTHITGNLWQICDLTPNLLTEIPPPRFWRLIGSRSFIFIMVPELVVTTPPALSVWQVKWIWSFPLPPNIVKSLMSLFFSSIFGILSLMRLTTMVLSLLIWTTCSRPNTSPSNYRSLPHSFHDLPGTSIVVWVFTHIILLMLKGLTKYLSSYQV